MFEATGSVRAYMLYRRLAIH
ncbi:hypothetical protein L9W92_08825 [Pelotomaculum terephthalicicum JT]|nr:hypothetical protein [Pelotomaculum terephthalicicum JT]